MARLRTSTVASFVRSLESISGKASLLAESQTYLGSPAGWQAAFARYRAATPKQLPDAGRKWLSDGDYVLRLQPFGHLATPGCPSTRSHVPARTGAWAGTVPKG